MDLTKAQQLELYNRLKEAARKVLESESFAAALDKMARPWTPGTNKSTQGYALDVGRPALGAGVNFGATKAAAKIKDLAINGLAPLIPGIGAAAFIATKTINYFVTEWATQKLYDRVQKSKNPGEIVTAGTEYNIAKGAQQLLDAAKALERAEAAYKLAVLKHTTCKDLLELMKAHHRVYRCLAEVKSHSFVLRKVATAVDELTDKADKAWPRMEEKLDEIGSSFFEDKGWHDRHCTTGCCYPFEIEDRATGLTYPAGLKPPVPPRPDPMAVAAANKGPLPPPPLPPRPGAAGAAASKPGPPVPPKLR